MATRELPEHRNPLLTKDAPPYEVLVERRCLGQTELKVKPGQVGTSNATKPDNLGTLDYAHLRVPLPKDLNGSGIFIKQSNRKWPESYFLMRRSTDGFISATGMFKAAFPWSQQEEEAAEKDFIKNLEGTSSEEIAGNVWLHPEQALALADDYDITHWITALLDPEPITHGTNASKNIQSPPTYRVADVMNGDSKKSKSPTPKKTASRKSVRSTRSVSPVKKTPARKIATPRKPRTTRRKAEVEAEADEATSVQGDALNGEPEASAPAEDTVKLEVETAAQPTANGEEEVEQTRVNIEMPANSPELEIPDNAQDMLAQAREMVDEANKLNNGAPAAAVAKGKGKRKADDIAVDEDEAVATAAGPDPKRTKTVQMELRKERIKRRALTGIAASLAIGALVPSIMTAFGAS